MKTTPVQCALAAVVLLSTLTPPLSTLLAQGSLTPPGAPAPTMRSLDQIEPRTPISAAPFTITSAGSYYLTTNLTVATGDAITIATNGVTLDLTGFTIFSTAPSATGYAIRINGGLRNLTIVNGFIQGGVTNNAGTYNGPGFQNGINYSGTVPVNVRVAGVSVSGCLAAGIWLSVGDSTVVESCTVRTVGGSGIVASTIKSSVAVDCGGDAIYGEQVSDSRGECTGSGTGLYAATALNCIGESSSSGRGLSASSSALNCFGYSSTGTGLYAYTAQNCYGYSTSGNGIFASRTAQNCYGRSDGSGEGLYAAATAHNCTGESSSGEGLSAYNAENCFGYSGSNGTGIYASSIAQNCQGWSTSGYGICAVISAQNCFGQSGSGTGLKAFEIAIGCRGASASGTGLSTYLANSCTGSGAPGVSATYKYNMP